MTCTHEFFASPSRKSAYVAVGQFHQAVLVARADLRHTRIERQAADKAGVHRAQLVAVDVLFIVPEVTLGVHVGVQ
jgi:hypothetical protein